jgi:hypothetical protein
MAFTAFRKQQTIVTGQRLNTTENILNEFTVKIFKN